MNNKDKEREKPRKRKLKNTERRGIETKVKVRDDRFPKWILELMEEINPDKAPKPIRYEEEKSRKRRLERRQDTRALQLRQQPRLQTIPQSAQLTDQKVNEQEITRINLLVKSEGKGSGVGVQYRKQICGETVTIKTASLYFEDITPLQIIKEVLTEVNDKGDLVIIYHRGIDVNKYQVHTEPNKQFKFRTVLQALSPRYNMDRLNWLSDNALDFKSNKIYDNRNKDKTPN